MPTPLAALFAAAIYQQRSALADMDALDRTVSLLARAAGRASTSFEVRGDDLMIDGTPLSMEAPGATLIRHALVDHHTARLTFPSALSAAQWREVVEVFASAPGLFPTVDEVRDALRFSVADAVVSGTIGVAAEGDLRQSLFELPGLRGTVSPQDAARAHESREHAMVVFTEQLDPLLKATGEAKVNHDYLRLAQLLLQINELAVGQDNEVRAVAVRERRHAVPAEVLADMARLIPKQHVASGTIARTLGTLGGDGATALLDALSGASSPQDRRAYIDALVACRDCDKAIIDALSNQRPELVRDAAEVVGRKRLQQAVPVLTRLLKHAKVDVRTTAWHALELIGTRDALAVLRS